MKNRIFHTILTFCDIYMEEHFINTKKETLTPFINIIDILLKTNLDEVVALFDKMEIGVDLTIQK